MQKLREYKHLGGLLGCTHPKYDPTFAFQECSDCNSYLWDEVTELQADFDRERFIDEVRKVSLARLEKRKGAAHAEA